MSCPRIAFSRCTWLRLPSQVTLVSWTSEPRLGATTKATDHSQRHPPSQEAKRTLTNQKARTRRQEALISASKRRILKTRIRLASTMISGARNSPTAVLRTTPMHPLWESLLNLRLKCKQEIAKLTSAGTLACSRRAYPHPLACPSIQTSRRPTSYWTQMNSNCWLNRGALDDCPRPMRRTSLQAPSSE